MRKLRIYIFLFLWVGLFTESFAQLDRSRYPDPAPAREINIQDAQTFTLANGLKVYVVENHKLPKVSISIIFDRSPILEGDKRGLGEMMGTMMSSGTKNRSKEQFAEETDLIAASISFGSTSASTSYLKKYQDKALDLFTDALYNPSFPESELDKLKTQMLSALAMSKDEPSAILSKVFNTAMYGSDHPYGENANETTIKNIQVEDFKNYYENYYRPNIAYLAIVGDVTLAEAKKLANDYFGKWEKKEVEKKTWHDPKKSEGLTIALVEKPTAKQSLINVFTPLNLKNNDEDVLHTALLGRIFGGGSSGRLFMNLRESKGYTYGAYGSISPGRYWGDLTADANVGTHVTDSAVYEFLYEIERMQQGTVTQEELDLAKSALAGSFGRSLENPSTVASFAINIDYYDLKPDHYKTYLKRLEAITLDEVNALAKKYFDPKNLYIAIHGNTQEFVEPLSKLGKVVYYNEEGNEVVKEDFDTSSVSANQIVEDYLKAIGGVDKLKSIKSIHQTSEATIQGMTLQMVLYTNEETKKASQVIQVNGMELSKIEIDGDKVQAFAQGQEMPLSDEDKKNYVSMTKIIADLDYLNNDHSLAVLGISEINGERAYEVEVTNANGKKSKEFYAVDSKLKLKTQSESVGEIVYSDYKSFNDILIPTTITTQNNMLPMPIQAKLIDVKFNQ